MRFMKDINPYPDRYDAPDGKDRRFGHSVWPWVISTPAYWGYDWYCIHDATGGYVSDACVEGPGYEFLELAAALRRRESATFRRCSVEIVEIVEIGSEGGYEIRLKSPRNTHGGYARLLERADDLAEIIESAVRYDLTVLNLGESTRKIYDLRKQVDVLQTQLAERDRQDEERLRVREEEQRRRDELDRYPGAGAR